MSFVESKYKTRIEEAVDLTQAANTEVAIYSDPDNFRLHTAWAVVKTDIACDVTDIVLSVRFETAGGTEVELGTITITDAADYGDVFEMVWASVATLHGYNTTLGTDRNLALDPKILPGEKILIQVKTQGVDLTTLAGTCDVYLSMWTA